MLAPTQPVPTLDCSSPLATVAAVAAAVVAAAVVEAAAVAVAAVEAAVAVAAVGAAVVGAAVVEVVAVEEAPGSAHQCQSFAVAAHAIGSAVLAAASGLLANWLHIQSLHHGTAVTTRVHTCLLLSGRVHLPHLLERSLITLLELLLLEENPLL